MTGGHDPFTADVDKALDALTLAWGDSYDEIWFHDGAGWGRTARTRPMMT